MAAGKYVRFGLRADKNLSDIPNQNTSLSNILDDLVPNVAFTPQDLKVIDDLQTTDVFASDLAELAGREVKYRPLNTDDNGVITIGNPIPVQPTVTISDSVVNRKVIMGDPPFRLGGEGPICKIIPTNDVDDGAFNPLAYNNNISSPPSAETIFDLSNSSVVTSNDFWVDGRFAFGTTFDASFANSFGGLMWEGYLSWPTGRNLRVVTNGFWLIERDVNNNNTWEKVAGIWYEEVTILALGTATDTLEIELSDADIANIAVGMKIDYDSDLVDPNNSISTFEITGIDRETNTVSLTPEEGAVDSGLTFTGDRIFTAYWKFGETDITSSNFDIPPQFTGETVHYRFSAWWPTPTQLGIQNVNSYRTKYITWDNGDSGRDDFMPYNYWYRSLQTTGTTDQFTYQYFKENKVGPENAALDTVIENNKPIFIRYEPTVNTADYSRYNSGANPTTTTLIWNGDFSFSVQDPENENLNGIIVGDVMIPQLNPVVTQKVYYFNVYEKTSTTLFVNPFLHTDIQTIMADLGISIGGTINVNVFTSVGLSYIGEHILSNNSATAGNPMNYFLAPVSNQGTLQYKEVDIKPDNLVIELNTGTGVKPRFRRITDVTNVSLGSDVEFDTHPIDGTDTGSVTDGSPVLVYTHRGLNDNSISSQCNGVYGKEIASFPTIGPGSTAKYPSGNTQTIHLYDVEGISVGDIIQYPGFIVGYNPLNTNPSDANQNGDEYATVTAINTTPTWSGGFEADGTTQKLTPSITIQHGTTGSGTTTNTIITDLNNAYTLIFIKAAEKATHTPQGETYVDDKNYCVLPLNTAPPFLGSDDGLSTSVEFPHLVVNGDVETTGLQFDQAATQEIGSAGYATASAAVAQEGFYIKQYNTNKEFWILIN